MSFRRVIRNLSIVFSLLLLLVIGLVVYVMTLDPSQFRGQITDYAASQGIDLQINGEMSWRLYPELSLQIGEIAVGMERPEAAYTADVQRVELLVELWPLLQREFRLRGLLIDGARIELAQREPEQAVETEVADGGEATDEAEPAPLPVIVAERMEVADSSLRILDPSGNENLAVEGLNLVLQNFNLGGAPANLEGRFVELRSGGEPLVTPLQFALQLSAQPEFIAVQIEELTAGLPLAEGRLDLALVAEATYRIVEGTFSLGDLRLSSGNSLVVTANLEGQSQPLSYEGDLDLLLNNPRQLMARLGIEAPDVAETALQRFSLQSTLAGSDTSVNLSSLRWQLDQSNFQGSLQLGWGDLTSLVLRGQLDQINLDDYMAQAESEEPGSEPQAESAPLIPVLPFNRSDIDLEISSLEVAAIPMQRAHLVVNSNTRQLRLQELSAQLFGGSFDAQATVQLAGELPHQFDMEASNIAIDQFLATRMEEVPFAGQVSMQLNGLAVGATRAELVQGLEADGRLQAGNLVLRGQDIEQRLCDISDRVQRRSLQSSYTDWGESTRFQDVNATLRVENGEARLQSLTSGIGNIAVTGQGNFLLEQKDYEMDINARVEGEQTSIQGCTVHPLLRNRQIPLHCEGNASDPESLDCGVPQDFTRGLLRDAVTNQLSNQLLGDDAETSGDEEQTPRNLLEGLLRRSLGQ